MSSVASGCLGHFFISPPAGTPVTIALARRYRPRRFADLVVQDHVAAALRGAVAKGRVGHGYLLTGPRGVGKTTAARILAMALNCVDPTYCSDKSEGPTAGSETLDPLAFLARVLAHIPDKGQVTTRYYGWYANRPRGMRRRAASAGAEADGPVPIVIAPRLAAPEASRRWAALLRRIFEVDPLRCPHCAGPMRIVAVITQTSVIDQILTHLRARITTPGARSPPSTRAPAPWGAARRRRATPAPHPAP
jgi:energy-coupling factor transporter ATP-binding protein EcfA2